MLFLSFSAQHIELSHRNALFLTCLLLVIAKAYSMPASVSEDRKDVLYNLAYSSISSYHQPLQQIIQCETNATSWWLEHIPKQGRAAFNPNPQNYSVYRNVKYYGAKGDGYTDDTKAINAAIQDGSRCGQGCDSSTVTPALVYFPPGTYIVSEPIIAYYYSQLVGNPISRPIIKGSATFKGIALVDADPYNKDGTNWYTNQNNFFRSIRNIILDTTGMPAEAGTCLHWQIAQASSLVNLQFVMSQEPGNKHQGIITDNGSGGFMSDLEFIGGKYGAFLGNQQFLSRKMSFKNCQTAIFVNWDWHWTFKSIDIEDCEVGVDISALNKKGIQDVASIILLDAKITNTPIGLKTSRNSTSKETSGGSAVFDNVHLANVDQAVASTNNETILAGGMDTIIDLWGQGRVYNKNGDNMNVTDRMARPFTKPFSLLDPSSGRVFERTRPLYVDVPASSFISVRSYGAKGDGKTDDTAALKRIFLRFGGDLNKIIYFDHGVYVVSSTIEIPVNTRIVGEVWATIMACGDAFQNPNAPVPVWKVGCAGDVGTVEISELIFQTRGAQPGAILMEWNSRDPEHIKGANGMWDVHFRVGGSRGTELEPAQCIKSPNATEVPDPKCQAGFLHLHITKTAGLYIENCWAWTSDHGLDAPFDQITIYNARGILIESQQPVWMYGTAAEHNVLYQYQLNKAKNVFMAAIQTETPYFQGNPGANVPFPSLSEWNDPDFSYCTTTSCKKAWALRVLNSHQNMIYGAGLYSFFENYNDECAKNKNCQESVVDIRNSEDFVIYNHNTVATTSMVNVEGRKVVEQSDNTNSFTSTVMMFALI